MKLKEIITGKAIKKTAEFIARESELFNLRNELAITKSQYNKTFDILAERSNEVQPTAEELQGLLKLRAYGEFKEVRIAQLQGKHCDIRAAERLQRASESLDTPENLNTAIEYLERTRQKADEDSDHAFDKIHIYSWEYFNKYRNRVRFCSKAIEALIKHRDSLQTAAV